MPHIELWWGAHRPGIADIFEVKLTDYVGMVRKKRQTDMVCPLVVTGKGREKEGELGDEQTSRR